VGRDEFPDRIIVHPGPHPYNSVAAREENPIDTVEGPAAASLSSRGTFLDELERIVMPKLF
jgi:hypothetical protein